MVFYVVAASLPQNSEDANLNTIKSCTTFNGRPVAQMYPVNVSIRVVHYDIG